MKLIALRYFNEVARLGSIRRAAELLHVAPSAVSRQVAQLEEDLDTTLLLRSKSGVELTHAGEVYFRQTRRILLDLNHAKQSLDDMRGLRRGEVNIAVIEGLVSELLPRITADFHRRYPKILFKVRTMPTDDILAALMDHEADIGLTFNAPERAEIQIIEEYTEPISCLVAPHHRFANAKQLSLADIAKAPMAMAESNFGLRRIIEKALGPRRAGIQPVITTNSLEFTKAMAMTGEVVSFMPMLTVQREIRSGLLHAIPIDSPALASSTTSLCIHRDRPLSYPAREFLKLLRAEFCDLSAKK